MSDEWIERRTGIRERRYAAPGERVSDLATRAGAARPAPTPACDASELDMVLVATLASDEITPATAPIVAHELGVGACGRDRRRRRLHRLARRRSRTRPRWIESGRARNVLVIGAEILSPLRRLTTIAAPRRCSATAPARSSSRSTPRADRAVRVRQRRRRGRRDPRHARERRARDGRPRDLPGGRPQPLARAPRRSSQRAGLELADIDLFVYHQANSRILAAVAERLGAARASACSTASRELGNTSAASVPLALAEAVRDGRAAARARASLLGAIGAGLSVGRDRAHLGPAVSGAGVQPLSPQSARAARS